MNLGTLVIGAGAVLATSAWLLSKARSSPSAPAPTAGPGALPAWYRTRLEKAGLVAGPQQALFALLHASAIATGALGGMWVIGNSGPVTAGMAAIAGLGAYVGWMVPASWLGMMGAKRRIEIAADFPLMLDLVELSLQGGLSLQAAWMAVATHLDDSSPAMAEEMRRIELEVAFGSTWTKALVDAARRTGVGQFESLGSLLGQTERFGTEVAVMVRVMADSLRHEESQILEERAHRASVLMVLILAGTFLPATVIVIGVPLITMFLESMREVNVK